MLTNIREAHWVPKDWRDIAHAHLTPPRFGVVAPTPEYVGIAWCVTPMIALNNGWRIGLSPCGQVVFVTPSESAKRAWRKRGGKPTGPGI